ncbi:MAG: HPF/RaiA family ribosome-associated protein [Arenimonas sp.]|uniref:HPF/RaiA family ribosome-associated protein n=1 Tax=Arenimonas sp. TaxID=1872635 RepID=UPI0025C41ACB|nr:HPF/RaiA family ribosome-associated protein [Arenimonas sp.]MBW8368050.1 HPF/RaiA family ribosome-associated protein [Arenimonas sp.]
MQIQINTGESVNGREALYSHAENVVKDVLGRFADHVTRIEIHMSDVNGQKAGDKDKRVLMEARIAGRQPLAVTELAGSLHQAIDGAAQKLRRTLDTTFGKMADKRRVPAPPLPADPALPGDDPV